MHCKKIIGRTIICLEYTEREKMPLEKNLRLNYLIHFLKWPFYFLRDIDIYQPIVVIFMSKTSIVSCVNGCIIISNNNITLHFVHF